ncbi:hypothetical protein RI543_003531 [Arxiozyma heterogenica]|uniref:ER membrane protein complex subunit 1 n=1 Tax=Arxiozyma heterogenica TaxID=278026 RepID=A0AAN7ZSE1_9SACH|nr:hypothetical protein RI543_003531 [Kazachstania heterogenica]
MWWANWLCLVFSLLRLTFAVFIDEVGVTDWALQSIGEYRCIVGDYIEEDLFLIVSNIDNISLLSLVNRTNGNLITRRVTASRIVDVKYDELQANLLLYDEDHATSQLSILNKDIYLKEISSMDVNYTIPSLCNKVNYKNIVITLEENMLKVIDPESKLTVISIPLPSNFKGIEYLKTDYLEELEILLSTNDLTYFYHNLTNDISTNSWYRDESVTDIVDFEFVDIIDHSMDSISMELNDENTFNNIWQAYNFRVKTNFNRLKKYAKAHHYSPGRMITDFFNIDLKKNVTSEKSLILRNSNDLIFGFKKLLVVLTQNRQLIALDINRGGEKIWSIQSKLSNVVSSFDWDATLNQLIIFNDQGDYEIWNLLKPVLEPTFKQNGTFKDSLPNANCNILDINRLSHNDKTYHVQLDCKDMDSNRIDMIVSLRNIHNNIHSTRFFVTHDNTTIKGHVVLNNTNKVIPTWQITLDNPNEKIVAFSYRHDVETVNPGLVLGNRTVLYKYLYPNIASYIVFNKITNKIYINIIDTLKGEILVSQMHDREYVDIDYPINILIGEHWVIYSYFSLEPIPEQKINVIELYESLIPNERISDSDNENFNPLKQSIKPKHMSRSYYYPEIINKMSISETKFDITTKSIILELANGQITFLPKYIIDARKKTESEMTDDDKKEFMASSYIPTIPINDLFVITHKRDLVFGKLSKLGSIATNLESTSIVCDVGHDIFCSRITPSGSFDVLDPNFETGKLVVSILVCLLLYLFLRPYVTKRRIKGLWLVHE